MVSFVLQTWGVASGSPKVWAIKASGGQVRSDSSSSPGSSLATDFSVFFPVSLVPSMLSSWGGAAAVTCHSGAIVKDQSTSNSHYILPESETLPLLEELCSLEPLLL
jgi:hypothetical protein